MELRKIVRAARELQKIKIKEIAEKIEKSKGGIANWERGIATLSEATIRKICQEIGIDYERKRFLKKDEVFYFYLNYEKDIDYLNEISKILDITEIVEFESLVVLHENYTDNFYVISLSKEREREKFKSFIKNIFANAIIKTEFENEEIKHKMKDRELTKEDFNRYLYFTYCYKSRRVLVKNTDGSTSYVHEIPIATILRDFFKYVIHETNEEKKRKHLQDLVLEYCTKFENVDKEEYEKRLEKVLKNFGL